MQLLLLYILCQAATDIHKNWPGPLNFIYFSIPLYGAVWALSTSWHHVHSTLKHSFIVCSSFILPIVLSDFLSITDLYCRPFVVICYDGAWYDVVKFPYFYHFNLGTTSRTPSNVWCFLFSSKKKLSYIIS